MLVSDEHAAGRPAGRASIEVSLGIVAVIYQCPMTPTGPRSLIHPH